MVLMLMVILILPGCGNGKQSGAKQYLAFEDFNGQQFGALTGAPYETIMGAECENMHWHYYDDFSTGLASLIKGDIDTFVTDTPMALMAAAQFPDKLAVYPQDVTTTDFGYILKKGGPLTDLVSGQVKDLLQDGTVHALEEKWFSGDPEKMKIDWDAYDTAPRPNGCLQVYVDASTMPMIYVGDDGRASGLEAELALIIADRMDMGIEFHNSLAASVMMYVQTGKADLGAACFTVTEERKQSVDFCYPYYTGGVNLICRKENLRQVLSQTQAEKDLNAPGTVIAVETGTHAEADARAEFTDAEFLMVPDVASGFLAVTEGKAEGFATARSSFERFEAAGNTGLKIYQNRGIGETGNIAIGVSKATKLDHPVETVNRFLADLSADGTLEDMRSRWLVHSDYEMPEIAQPQNPDHKVVIGTTGLVEPYTFYGEDEQLTGLDLEMIRRFALWDNAEVEIVTYDWGGLVAACVSGKVDYAMSNLMATPERRASLDFSSPYSTAETVIAVPRVQNVIEELEEPGFFETVKENFEKTFVRESRWKLVMRGLGVTLEISLLAGLLGTVLGTFLCLGLRSKIRMISMVCRGFSNLMQGIPSLVVLMIANFVIFGNVSINPVLVGVLSFGVIFAVAVAGVLNSGINTVDKGQWEAATTLGFGKAQTFVRIILPQALRHAIPLYKGEFVSMMKLTSIVGYISIEDLTKASDIIRSRTYEAFFPLISTAVIYFIMSALLTGLIGRVEIRLDPKHKPRKLPKGVDPDAVPSVRDEDANAEPEKGEIIHIAHLQKKYPNVTPLKDVNTTIRQGEVITIIGPSGTGKSTLMRCINRLETPTDGVVTVFGQDMSGKPADRAKVMRRMGMVFQSFNLFGHMTVIENVMLAPVLLKGRSRQAAYENAMHLLRKVGMAEKALNYPDELSGGQKQRVAIARTLAMDPEIIFFDEPTSALDPTMVGEVLAVIRSLARKGLTMMIVTHEMKFARDVSTRIFYMDQGVIYEDGTPDQIFDNPQKDRTRRFVRRLKVLEIQVDSPDFDFIGTMNRLEEFGRKHMMNQKTIVRMQTVFEELCMQTLLPRLGEEIRLHMTVEYSEETGHADMTFQYNGPDFDPLKQEDDLSAMMVKGSAARAEHIAHPEDGDYTNELKITLKD